jgi:hypothetical protein
LAPIADTLETTASAIAGTTDATSIADTTGTTDATAITDTTRTTDATAITDTTRTTSTTHATAIADTTGPPWPTGATHATRTAGTTHAARTTGTADAASDLPHHRHHQHHRDRRHHPAFEAIGIAASDVITALIRTDRETVRGNPHRYVGCRSAPASPYRDIAHPFDVRANAANLNSERWCD